MMIPPDDTTKLINYVSAQGTAAIGDVLKQHPTLDRAALWRTLAWLIKLGILRVM